MKCTLTLQVKHVAAKHRELRRRGVPFVNPPGKYFWGYGAELNDPDGYLIDVWDKVSMRTSMREDAAAKRKAAAAKR